MDITGVLVACFSLIMSLNLVLARMSLSLRSVVNPPTQGRWRLICLKGGHSSRLVVLPPRQARWRLVGSANGILKRTNRGTCV